MITLNNRNEKKNSESYIPLNIKQLACEYEKKLADEFSLLPKYVKNIINLIDEGNTIPFIARYRKELTGNMDDVTLRNFCSQLEKYRSFTKRQIEICALIQKQGKLTENIVLQIKNASNLHDLDDIYMPFKPKKRTKASIARENGLQPLAEIFISQNYCSLTIEKICQPFLNSAVSVTEDALEGVVEILSELFSENSSYRTFVRNYTFKNGSLICSEKKKSSTKSEISGKKNYGIYSSYFDYNEKITKVPNHRILLLLRGEKEDFLSVKVKVETDDIYLFLRKKVIKSDNSNNIFAPYLDKAVKKAYTKSIAPCIEREIIGELYSRAEKGAVHLFEKNLKTLLMQPPLKDKIILGLDPGFRTGCKTAVIDTTGKVLHTETIYPDFKNNKFKEAEEMFLKIIDIFHVDTIAIGNGTATGESEIFVSEALKKYKSRQVKYTIVNEAGASVYSASELGAKELPELDVTLRGAVSIARRLQDNMAELVKISPRSIGVGQYQHDVNKQLLDKSLADTVESCVNSVGVDVNTASVQLLSYISGLNASTSRNIVKLREKCGRFNCREDLKKVEKLGPKAFQQSAGFLRVFGGSNPLDETSIHPESYNSAKEIMRLCSEKNIPLMKVLEDEPILKNLSEKIGTGLLTAKDIIKQLIKPGYDVRNDFEIPDMRDRAFSIKDLKINSIVHGVIRNITDFGAFVDIGVHQDGLLHISEISVNFVSDIYEYLKIGDKIKVKITEIDTERNRISLSMKEL